MDLFKYYMWLIDACHLIISALVSDTVIPEYYIPSDLTGKSTAPLQIKISAATRQNKQLFVTLPSPTYVAETFSWNNAVDF